MKNKMSYHCRSATPIMLSRFRDILSAIDVPSPRLGPPDEASTLLAICYLFITYHTCRILYIECVVVDFLPAVVFVSQGLLFAEFLW